MRKPTNLQALKDFGTMSYETYLSFVLRTESMRHDQYVLADINVPKQSTENQEKLTVF